MLDWPVRGAIAAAMNCLRTWLALFLLLFAGAQPVLAREPQQQRAVVLTPALWKVGDRDTTIYLFGTIHVLPQGQTWFAGKLAKAVDRSSELVTELGEIVPTEVSRVVTELGFLPPGQSLRAQMSVDDRQRYEAALAAIQYPPEAFDRLKPWYAANSLLLLQLRQSGIAGANGPEQFLTDRFAAARKPHSGLESIGYQLGLFDSLPMDLQLRYLKEVAAGGTDLVAQFDTIHREWGAGRSEELAKVLNGTFEEPQLQQRMLLDRNKAWGQWVKTRLDRPGTVFLAVGAGHLAGQGSLQDQLRSLGLKVQRVQ